VGTESDQSDRKDRDEVRQKVSVSEDRLLNPSRLRLCPHVKVTNTHTDVGNEYQSSVSRAEWVLHERWKVGGTLE
jgi:hypothetical protein